MRKIKPGSPKQRKALYTQGNNFLLHHMLEVNGYLFKPTISSNKNLRLLPNLMWAKIKRITENINNFAQSYC